MRAAAIGLSLWVVVMLLCGVAGYAAQQRHNSKVEQCFKFEDDQQRYACVRRV